MKIKLYAGGLWLFGALMASTPQGDLPGLVVPGISDGGNGRNVRVAGIVLKWVFADREANFRRAESLIREAAAKGAKIVCTAESFLDGYSVRDDEMSPENFLSLAEPVPAGPYMMKLRSLCGELSIYLIAGLTEKADGKVFNSAVLIGPEGEVVGTYRKKFLWPTETGRYAAGDSFPAFATGFGRIGMMICSDRRNPESVRELAANGADIVFCLAGGGYGPENDQMMRQRSKEGGVPIVFVHPVEFLVTGPAGEILDQSLHGEALDEDNKDSRGGVARVHDVPMGKMAGAFPLLSGPYLGQKPPGRDAEVFAPGIVSTRADEYALEVSRDGNEIVFVRDDTIMLVVRGQDGTWKPPAVAPFSGKHVDGEPCYSPDGRRIYFTSRRPAPNSKRARNTWVSTKKDGVWRPAIPFDAIPWEKTVHAMSMAANGNVYEDGIIRFPLTDGKYRPAERLSPPLKGMYPFIAPDEGYIVFSDRPPGKVDADLFASFRRPDGSWAPPAPLGGAVNSRDWEGNSFVTADGRFLFFSRKMEIYWVSATVIEKLRPKE